MKKWIFPSQILLILLFIVGCRSATVVIDKPITAPLPEQLTELKQISDYPFYEAHHVGDYGFAEYIKTGQYASLGMEPNFQTSFACSVYAAYGEPNHVIFGRNFDWHENYALILFTQPPDGYASVSMVDISYLGYNRYHSPLGYPKKLLETPYQPFDGMNAQGLAVGMMAVSHAEGGNDPEKVTLDSLELIRLMLDYAGNVEQALELITDFNVDFGSVPIHYLLADRSGNSAVVEYLDGEPVVVKGQDNWQVSTNFILSEENPSGADSSCRRYNHLIDTLEDSDGQLNIAQGMELLRAVSQEGEMGTRWSMIYDLTSLDITVAINRDYQRLYEFTLDD